MLVPSSAVYDRRVPTSMLLPSGLTCARIILHNDPDPDPGASIVLLSYRSSHLTALHRQDLAPLRLRNEPR